MRLFTALSGGLALALVFSVFAQTSTPDFTHYIRVDTECHRITGPNKDCYWVEAISTPPGDAFTNFDDAVKALMEASGKGSNYANEVFTVDQQMNKTTTNLCGRTRDGLIYAKPGASC